MVFQLTGAGRSFDRKGNPFRRRSALPLLIVVAVLAVIGIATWARALSFQEEVTLPASCPAPTPQSAGADGAPPPPAPARFDVVPPADMVSVPPAPLGASPVRVLNASGQAGLAETTFNELTDFGFAAPPVSPYGNDSLYSQLDCQTQLRFGDAGRAAAAAAWVVTPCAELINDGRPDNSVDLALGTFFTGLEPSTDAQEILRILRAAPLDGPDGGANPALVAAVHDAACTAA